MNKNFRSHVLRSSDEAKGFGLVLDHFFASAHINKFEVPVSADHDVLGFEISIDDAFLMEGFEDMNEESYIKSRLFKGEDSYASDNIEKVFSFDVLCEKVDIIVIFEGAVVLNNERTIFKTDET